MLVFLAHHREIRCMLCDVAVDDADAHGWDVHDVPPTAVLIITDARWW